jgi:hypothetical protein
MKCYTLRSTLYICIDFLMTHHFNSRVKENKRFIDFMQSFYSMAVRSCWLNLEMNSIAKMNWITHLLAQFFIKMFIKIQKVCTVTFNRGQNVYFYHVFGDIYTVYSEYIILRYFCKTKFNRWWAPPTWSWNVREAVLNGIKFPHKLLFCNMLQRSMPHAMRCFL